MKGNIVWNWHVEFKDPENIQLEHFTLDYFFHPHLQNTKLKLNKLDFSLIAT